MAKLMVLVLLFLSLQKNPTPPQPNPNHFYGQFAGAALLFSGAVDRVSPPFYFHSSRLNDQMHVT